MNTRSDISGSVEVELTCDTDVVGVEMRSTRPHSASTIFVGSTPEIALQRVPLLFSLCATAQASAALSACEQALSIQPSQARRLAHSMLVQLEMAREHLLRIQLDWPGLVGEPLQHPQLPPLMQLLPRLTRALFGDSPSFCLQQPALAPDFKAMKTIFSELGAQIDQLLPDGLPANREALQPWLLTARGLPGSLLRFVKDQGWEALGRCDSRFLPPLEPSQLLLYLEPSQVEDFVATPHWHGKPHETTPLQRQQHHPLIRGLLAHEGNGLQTRLLALLQELVLIPTQLRESLTALQVAEDTVKGQRSPSGSGLAQIEAARGRLIHWLEIKNDRIQRFHVIAPTEWNFHPRGIAYQGLTTLQSSDPATLQRQAMLWLMTIDPCVAIKLRIHDHA